jgi:hypothetical protein
MLLQKCDGQQRFTPMIVIAGAETDPGGIPGGRSS